MAALDAGVIIPVVAIAGAFAVPVTAIIMDYKRRKLISEERRAMIEKGMEPPVIEEQRGFKFRDPATLREKSLHTGIISIAVACGLAFGAWLLVSVVTRSFIPPELAGPLTLGAAVMGFIGVGHLIYYRVSRRSGGEPSSGS